MESDLLSTTRTKIFSFSTTCRLCLAPQTNMIRIFDNKFQDLPNNIFYCTSIRVIQNDRLPHAICNTCFDQILKFITFKQICHKADELLRESINSDCIDEIGIDRNLFDNDLSKPLHIIEQKYIPEALIEPPLNDFEIDEKKPIIEEIEKDEFDDGFDDNNDSFDDYENNDDDDDDEDFKTPEVPTKHPGNKRGRPPGRKSIRARTKRRKMLTRIIENDIFDDYEDDSIDSYLVHLERQDMIKEAAKCNYVCNICFATSKTILDYLEHQESHEGKPVFHCDRCPEMYTKKADLIIHEGTHQVPCPTCGKLVRPISLKTHMVAHTDKFMCSKCGVRTGNKKQLESHDFLVHNEIREHVCEACGKRFKTKSALITHNKSHSDIRAYPCKICSYAGRTASGLYTHMTQHTNEHIVCDICQKIFTSRRRLNDHKWRIHNPEKKHVCTFCFKKFSQRSKLTLHMRVHTGDRPFSCKFCARSYARREVCRAHEHKCGKLRTDRVITPPVGEPSSEAIIDSITFYKKIDNKFCSNTFLPKLEHNIL